MSDNFLFMITTHGLSGNLGEDHIDKALEYITTTVTNNTSKIFVGFDGDGAYATGTRDEWPTPSSTAVRIIDGLIKLGYKNVVLAQSQVYDYCYPPDDYSKEVTGTGTETETGITQRFHPYNTYKDTLCNCTGTETVNVISVPFYTIAYNKKKKEEQKDFIDENVAVDYGMRGEMGDKLLYTLPEQSKITLSDNEAELTLTDVAFLNVGLYGGTSHVKEGLKHDGVAAGSTDAWLKSKFLKAGEDSSRIPKENTHLIALWDELIEGNSKYKTTISRRTAGFMKDGGYRVTLIMRDKYNKLELHAEDNGTAGGVGGSRRKSKKRTRITKGTRKKGTRKSRKLRR